MVDAGASATTAKRNPWNEIECGSNYARSMASYALLNAFSGFEFNLPAGHIGFRPLRLVDGRFRCFWSLDPAWGEVLFSPEGAEVRVLYGSLSLRSLGLPFVPASVEVAGQPVGFVVRDGALHFGEPVTLNTRRWLRAKPRWQVFTRILHKKNLLSGDTPLPLQAPAAQCFREQCP